MKTGMKEMKVKVYNALKKYDSNSGITLVPTATIAIDLKASVLDVLDTLSQLRTEGYVNVISTPDYHGWVCVKNYK